LQQTPSHKTRVHFPETILKAAPAKMRGLVPACEQLPSPALHFRNSGQAPDTGWAPGLGGTRAWCQQRGASPCRRFPRAAASKEISAEDWTFKSFAKPV